MGSRRLAHRLPLPRGRRLGLTGLRAAALRRTAGRPLELPGTAPALPSRPRIVVLRPDHLGDIVFTGPALRVLAAAAPDAAVTVAVGRWSADVARLLPGPQAIETVRYPWFDRQPKPAKWVPYFRLIRHALDWRGRFDAAIVLRDDDWWSGLLARVARIPIRIGYAEPALAASLTHVLRAPTHARHAVPANTALVAALLAVEAPAATPAGQPLRLAIPGTADAAASRLLADSGVHGDDWWVLHPGSGSAIKRWPMERWVQLARAAPDASFVITGQAAEAADADRLAAALGRGAVSIAGRTSVDVLAAVVGRAAGALGPDSGPLHLAVAAGTPTVHLYGPAAAERFGPWGPPDRHRIVRLDLPCQPCGRLDWPDPENHPCVEAIPVAAVAFAWRDLYEALRRPPIISP